MTDRELLGLAAKAAGFSVWTDIDGNIFSEDQEGIECKWNPLVDDSDALRLVVICLINIEFSVRLDGNFPPDVIAYPVGWPSFSCRENVSHHNDRQSATRRAIVRAAAEIGKNMK